jgi:hypothetical protein
VRLAIATTWRPRPAPDGARSSTLELTQIRRFGEAQPRPRRCNSARRSSVDVGAIWRRMSRMPIRAAQRACATRKNALHSRHVPGVFVGRGSSSSSHRAVREPSPATALRFSAGSGSPLAAGLRARRLPSCRGRARHRVKIETTRDRRCCWRCRIAVRNRRFAQRSSSIAMTASG